MNRIIKERYPVEKLPEDLREGLELGAQVTVTIVEEELPPEKVPTLDELFALRQPPFRSGDEIDAAVRRSRDEWDE
jgi:hypothetical protein